MAWWNPISWIVKEVPSPGPGPKRESFEKRQSAKKAEADHKRVRDEEIDITAGDLSSLYGDKIEVLGELDGADDELDDLNARVARGETLGQAEVDRRNELETRIIPPLRTRLMGIEQQIRSLERTARRRYPHNFDFL